MLLDIFDNDNSIIINYKTINIFGINTAAYLSELIKIYKKALRKNKIDEEGYFKVDRKYISNLLNITPEEQTVCDLNLNKTGIIQKCRDNPDNLKIDVKLYISLLCEDDLKLYEDVRKQMKVKKPKGTKESQRQSYINILKDSIECSNYELLTALRNWVDGVYANPKGFLSKSSIALFQDTLNNYTKGDLDLALRIVNIATIQGYRDCSWAINMFEESEKRKKKQANNQIRITEQKVASKKDLSDIVF
jgi:hypothetical protein